MCMDIGMYMFMYMLMYMFVYILARGSNVS